MKVCFLVALAACTASRPELPPGLEWVQAPNDPLRWTQGGFFELVTPVRPPTSVDRSARISVVIRVPDGSRISSSLDAAGAVAWRVPPGTVAARVEYAASGSADAPPSASWKVLDVRQFEWTAQGRFCTVLRPAQAGSLGGVRWPCGEALDAKAGQALADLVRSGRLAGPADPAPRAAAATHLQGLNACSGCHQANRSENRAPTSLVQRATDAEGLFSLRSMLADEGPVERYRPVDLNRGDPLMRAVCPDNTEGAGELCADGQRPRLRLDVRRGLLEGSPHALAVCGSRRRLRDLLDQAGRDAFAAELAECDADLRGPQRVRAPR